MTSLNPVLLELLQMRTRMPRCRMCIRRIQEPESSSDEEEEEDEPMEVDSEPRFAPIEPVASTSKSPAMTLDVKGGFKWTDEPDEDEEISAGSSSDSSGDEKGGKKKKRKRKQVELDLTGDMHTRTPESNADFERLLLGSPELVLPVDPVHVVPDPAVRDREGPRGRSTGLQDDQFPRRAGEVERLDRPIELGEYLWDGTDDRGHLQGRRAT
jgi:hypothetical protein